MLSRTIVLIDGQCPLCVQSALRMRRWDKQGHLHIVNLHSAEGQALAAGRWSASDLRDEMRVQMPDGSWRTGWYGWAALAGAFGWGRLLAWAMRGPLLASLGPALYRWVAARRLVISRILRLPPPCDPKGVCRLENRV